MPTLQELAAEQAGNAANPWIQQYAADVAKEQRQPKPSDGPIVMPEQVVPPEEGKTHASRVQAKPSGGLAHYSESLSTKAPYARPPYAPPPPPGMLPPPESAGAPPGAPERPQGPGAATRAGPVGMSPDQRYEQKLGELEGRSAESSGLEQRGIQDQADVYHKGTLDRAMAEQVRKDEETVLQGKIDAAQQTFDQEAKTRADGIKARSEQVRAMHVDPQKWYKDRGVAGSILAALAMGAGAFGANMPHSGGKNFAQEILDKSMDREVKAQEGDIDNAWKGLESQIADSDKDYAHGQHKIASMQAAKIEAWGHATAQIQSVMARTEDQAKVAGMQGVLAYAQKKQQAAEEDYAKQHREVGNHILAQQQAAANAAAAEAKKRREWIREHAQKVALNPSAELSAQAQKLGLSLEEVASRQAAALYDGDRSNSGLVRIAPKAGAKSDKAAEGKAEMDSIDAMKLKSTNWEFWRGVQGTDAFKDRRNQGRFKSFVMGVAHKVHGARTPEAQHEIMGSYIPEDGDSQKTLDDKLANFKRDYGQILSSGNYGAAASAPEPEQ